MNLVDESAERSVLTGIFNYGNSALVEIEDVIDIDCFTNNTNQLIFKVLTNNLGNANKVDYATFVSSCNDLNLKHLYCDKEDLKYIRALNNFPLDLTTVRPMAVKLRKLNIARALMYQLDKIKSDVSKVTGSELIADILGLVEKPIFDFSSTLDAHDDNKVVQIADGVDDYITNIESNPQQSIGITTGFPCYDFAIGGGLRRKTVNLIGARPKTGKTQMAGNVGLNVSGRLKIPVLYLDTEMSQEDHWARILARITKISIKEIETGKYTQDEWKTKKIHEAKEFIKKIPYHYINVAGKRFDDIISIIRRWIMKTVGLDSNGNTKNCVVIYDYLKLMSSDSLDKGLQEYQALGFQISDLHNFAVKYDVPCLAFVQLNRDGIEKESTDVISQSDRLIWLCSNFSILKPKTQEEISEEGQEYGNRKLIPIVARHGEGLNPGDYINIMMKGHLAELQELGTRNQLHNLDDKEKF